jgi:regulator of protease activity HflC (stomatin/prohibitin superfamily)
MRAHEQVRTPSRGWRLHRPKRRSGPPPRPPEPLRPPKRRDPPRWALRLMRRRWARRAWTFFFAVIGLALVVTVSGVRVARQDVGYVGVVRNGGPLDVRTVRQVLLPGQGLTWIGFFSKPPHQYPAATVNRTYTVTSDPKRGNRPGVDFVTVPTKDGVLVGVEATVFLRFVGESNLDVLRAFEASYGSRRFPTPNGGDLHPWEGDEGFYAWLDTFLRPILDYNLRREIGGLQCAEVVSSCALVSRGATSSDKAPIANALLISKRISQALEKDFTRTVGRPYLRDFRMRISRVTLPKGVQAAIDDAQAQFAAVNGARAELKQAQFRAERNRLLGEEFNRSPGLVTVETMRAIPKGSTVILSTGGRVPSILAGAGSGATVGAGAGAGAGAAAGSSAGAGGGSTQSATTDTTPATDP